MDSTRIPYFISLYVLMCVIIAICLDVDKIICTKRDRYYYHTIFFYSKNLLGSNPIYFKTLLRLCWTVYIILWIIKKKLKYKYSNPVSKKIPIKMFKRKLYANEHSKPKIMFETKTFVIKILSVMHSSITQYF